MMSEYKAVFMEELDEQLQLMDECILKLEQDGDKAEAVQSLFRAAHTLKGSSAAMGFHSMKLLTHEMEHLLDQVRGGRLLVTAALIDLLFLALDNLKRLKLELIAGEEQATDISVTIEQLRRFGEGSADSEAVEQEKGAVASLSSEEAMLHIPVLSLADEMKAAEYLEQELQVNWVLMRISESCVIKGARAYVIQNALAEHGEILVTSPDPSELDESIEGELHIAVLHAGSLSRDKLQTLASGLLDVEMAIVQPYSGTDAETVRPKPSKERTAAGGAEAAASPGTKAKPQTIRVSVERMEHLMNLVGELVIDQTRIQQVEQQLKRNYTADSISDLAHISDHLSRVIGDLQDSVMKARMLPIEQLFNRFPRMIRDLSRDLMKDIELVIEGKDTELDRTLIEEISDPLIHLIRNAVDHGIEKPEARLAAGKEARGRLVIGAAHEDNQVVIYVRDDGAGINPDRMRASAVSKGMLSQVEAEGLTDREAVELIFHPGFSTACTVSDVSGRGVGMDIVKSHIEKLNGLIHTDTRPGEGTEFKIKLPLTLAIIEGLLVRLSEQTYIIPMSNIVEIVRVERKQLVTVQGSPVIYLRDQIIPVTWIQDHFRVEDGAEASAKHLSLVIVGSAEKRMALVVDELMGNQEIVIKSLGQYIGKVAGIAGGTILGDGRVALILEISALIQRLGGR